MAKTCQASVYLKWTTKKKFEMIFDSIPHYAWVGILNSDLEKKAK